MLNLLIGEKIFPLQKAVARAKNLRRHTVTATKIASVGDGDAQIPQRSIVLIQWHLPQPSVATTSRN